MINDEGIEERDLWITGGREKNGKAIGADVADDDTKRSWRRSSSNRVNNTRAE
jgi:hypothetical protein